MPANPLDFFTTKPSKSQKSVYVEEDLILHYRHDLPGELEISQGFTHHLITVFLTKNPQQITRLESHGEYDGQMSPGEFYLYPAQALGFTRWQAEDETLHMIVKPDLLRKVAAETECLNPERIEMLPVLKKYDPQMEHLTQLFMLEIQNNSLGSRLYLESLSNVLSVHLLRNYCVFKPVFRKYTDGLAPYKLRHIIDYIQAYLDRDLSLEVMAKEVNMSRYYFANQFKQAMGTSPHQYVIQQRVAKAKKLLKESNRSLTEIALDCGFANQSHFNRVFRQHQRITPYKYRQQL